MKSTSPLVHKLPEVFELVVAIASGACWAIANYPERYPDAIQFVVLACFAAIFPLLLIAGLRINMIALAVRKLETRPSDHDWPSFRELLHLIQLAPTPYLLIGAVGIVAYVCAPMSLTWSSAEAFTQAHALGFASFTLATSACLVPVLGALSRLPGAPAESAAWLLRMNSRDDG